MTRKSGLSFSSPEREGWYVQNTTQNHVLSDIPGHKDRNATYVTASSETQAQKQKVSARRTGKFQAASMDTEVQLLQDEKDLESAAQSQQHKNTYHHRITPFKRSDSKLYLAVTKFL